MLYGASHLYEGIKFAVVRIDEDGTLSRFMAAMTFKMQFPSKIEIEATYQMMDDFFYVFGYKKLSYKSVSLLNHLKWSYKRTFSSGNNN